MPMPEGLNKETIDEMTQLAARCPKKMQNGPCGASFNGRCELGGTCFWHEIYQQSKTYLSQLHGIEDSEPAAKIRGRWFADKRFVVTTEVTPPRPGNQKDSSRMRDFLASAKKIATKIEIAGINVVDCPLGIERMRGIEPCLAVKKAGLNPILQIVCRDRTKGSILKELKDAMAGGITDILALTGDWPKGRRAVFELDGTMLAALAKKSFPKMNVGVAVNPNVMPQEMELLKFRKKMRYADFAQSQAVFDMGVLEKFAAAHSVDKPILIGVLPLVSAEMALAVAKVPGMIVPEELISELNEDSTAGLALAKETIKKVRKLGFGGVHIMTFNNENLLAKLAAAARGRK